MQRANRFLIFTCDTLFRLGAEKLPTETELAVLNTAKEPVNEKSGDATPKHTEIEEIANVNFPAPTETENEIIEPPSPLIDISDHFDEIIDGVPIIKNPKRCGQC